MILMANSSLVDFLIPFLTTAKLPLKELQIKKKNGKMLTLPKLYRTYNDL